MFHKAAKTNNQGIGVVEIIVGTGILTLSLIGVIIAFNLHFQAGIENTKKIQAAYLLEEGMEVAQFFRNSNWTTNITTLTSDTPYSLFFNGVFWEATTSLALIDGVFERTIVLQDVYRRDADSDIVASTSPDANTRDPDARHVTVFVSWQIKNASTTATTTASLETYIINFLK